MQNITSFYRSSALGNVNICCSMSDRMKRNLLAALGFVFCLGALSLAVATTWDKVQPQQIEAE